MSCPTPPVPRRLALVLSIAFALLTLPAASLASRAPVDAELGGITTAAVTDCQLHQANCVVQGAIVSDVDDEYAWVTATGDTGDYAALVSSPGSGANEWTVLMVQNQGVPRSCSDYDTFGVPAEVLNDLEIQGLKPGSSTPVTCGTPAPQPKICDAKKVGQQLLGISMLRSTCKKARSLATSAQKRGKAPSGWALLRPDDCTGVLVPKKYRKAVHPLLDIPKSQPIIYIADETNAACTGDDSSSSSSATTAG